MFLFKVAACFLTMVGRDVCYKAPPQEPARLQSYTSSPAPPRLCVGLYTEWLGSETLQRDKDGYMHKGGNTSVTLYLHLPTTGGRHQSIQHKYINK